MYHYKEQSMLFTLTITARFGKQFSMSQLGLRMEHTRTTGISGVGEYDGQTYDYTRLFPTLCFYYPMGKVIEP